MPFYNVVSHPTVRFILLAWLVLLLGACGVEQAFQPPLPTPTRTPRATTTPDPWYVVTTPLPLPPTWPPTATPPPTAIPAMACLVTEVPANQHISASGSWTESETEAAGPMICRITPGSCPYQFLIGNLDPSIVSKREEVPPYDEEDIMMHPGMLLPLTRLNEMVQREWGGRIKLRVTDAYDSQLIDHDVTQPNLALRVALHYEGRSIDLTTWPIDRSLYPRLCAMAHCAGFDWVHNEATHCHASIADESLCNRC